MLDRAKQLQILVASYRQALRDVSYSLEALETGPVERTNYSTLARSFSTMKHDAHHVSLEKLSRLAGAAQAIVERAVNQKLGLPIDLLRAASKELEAANETIAAGGRHRLDARLLARLEAAARGGSVDAEPRKRKGR